MARTRLVGVKATTAQATTPPPAPEPANPSASAVKPSAGTGADASVPEAEHTTSGVFEVSLEGLGASAQDIEALRRIRASSPARPLQPNKSRKLDRLHPKHNHPNSRVQHRRVQQPTTSTSTSGRHGTSTYSRGKSPACCHNSTQLLRQQPQHQQPSRRPHRRPSSTSGTLYRPCKCSWTNGGIKRMHPKVRASASDTDKNTDKGRNTSRRTTPHSATLSRCPRSRSSSRAHHGPVASTPTPYPSTMETMIPKSSS
jgi:hypothetical protein